MFPYLLFFNYVTQNLKAMKSKLLLVMLALPMIMTSCSNDEDGLTITRSYDPEVMTSRACFNMESPKDAYLYPVVPGTSEWSALHEQGLEAVYKALRVPHSTLRKMSTMGLVQTFLDYPYRPNTMLSNSMAFYPFFLNHFEIDETCKSIYNELKRRSDVEVSLMTFYRAFVYNPMSHYADMAFENLNLMASIDVFYKQLDKKGKKEFIKIALEKEEMFDEDYKYWGTPYVCFLIARLMYSENYTPFVETINKVEFGESFLNDMDMCFWADENNRELILDFGREFIK